MTVDFKESRVPLAIFLVGVAIALIGDFLSIAYVMNAGFLCICLAIIALGIEMLTTGRAVFSTWSGFTWGHYERFSGLTARLWGVLFLIVGGFLGLATLVGADAFWSSLLATPRGYGILMLGVGVCMMMYGIIRIIAGMALGDSGLGAAVSNSLERIWGGLVLPIGLGIALIGLVLIVSPDIFLVPINQVLQNIPTPPLP